MMECGVNGASQQLVVEMGSTYLLDYSSLKEYIYREVSFLNIMNERTE